MHATVNAGPDAASPSLALVEVARDDIDALVELLDLLTAHPTRRFILFADDLSFDDGEAGYKALKAVLDGGLAGRPKNVLFYATSNRRHLLARSMVENEQSSARHPGEAVEEKISLSDRFGLRLGFHATDQADYLAMIHAYARHFGIAMADDELQKAALQWAAERGTRSGRAAWQFVQSLPESPPLVGQGCDRAGD